MAKVPGGLWQNIIAVQVYGANTGVGKTVFSTLLGAHFLRRSGRTRWSLHYVKPVSTGPEDEADDAYVRKYANVPVTTLFKFSEAVSPHVAARGKSAPTDSYLVKRLYKLLEDENARRNSGHGHMGIGLVETAGGPLSPGPSGTPQADLFRPLRLPVVLVGDHRLGGISSTISAAESLIMRGYDIDAVVCFNDGGKYENSEYLLDYFRKRDIATFEIPWIPDLEGCPPREESQRMEKYYKEQSGDGHIYKVAGRLIDRHIERLVNMKNISARTNKAIWHPFTQHKSIKSKNDILVFDSAYGDFFQTKHTRKPTDREKSGMLVPLFDGSASWWTQGLGHGNPELSLAASYAAGRYGHVMFAGATHEPAITLAERLLKGMENPRLAKCFYTDDGSTAAEAGIKMALRAASKRFGWDGSSEDVGILGLKGSYHGDTIGAMDASEPCVYNKKVDWYRGRGYWFDFPTVKMRKGRWLVEAPPGMEKEFGPVQYFDSLTEVFDVTKREYSPRYEEYIRKVLDQLVGKEGRKFGALVMEPILLGAGGMLFVDPVFQRTLVHTVRNYVFARTQEPLDPDINAWTGLPVMFDEVFTGLYRLGRFSAASLLQVHPDVSIHAKLLTGGLLPLSTTLASTSIFNAFLGDEKADALLHGHSYTAHPIGCHVANTTLQTMERVKATYTWSGFRKDWTTQALNGQQQLKINTIKPAPEDEGVWSFWSKDTVEKLSYHAKVDHVIAIGSVLAISLKDTSGSGYTSTAAVGLRDALMSETANAKMSVHTRVLGNVIYFMAAMTSTPKNLRGVEQAVLEKLDGVKGLRTESERF